MRLAVVGPAPPYKGGGAMHVTELVHRLRADGHDVLVESWAAQYPRWLYPGEQTTPGGDPDELADTRRLLAWYRPDSWWRCGRRLRDCDAVILSVLTPVQVPPYLGILRGLRGGRARTVALCHNVLPHERRRADESLMRSLLRRVDGVVVHSEEQAAVARGLTGRPVHVARMAPHLPMPPDPVPAPAQPYRRLLFFGIVRPYKGLDVLLRALAAGPPDVSLVVAGEFWEGTEATERLVEALGLGNRVALRAGYVPVDGLRELFVDVDALVLPYRSATASQNAWVGFQFGVPAIVTRAGALAESVHEGVDALVCDPDDVAGLAAALRRFYEPGTPERLRAGVRPIDPAPMWRRYLDVLVTAAGGAPVAAGPA